MSRRFRRRRRRVTPTAPSRPRTSAASAIRAPQTRHHLLQRWIGQECVGQPAGRLGIRTAELGRGGGSIGLEVVAVDDEPMGRRVRDARRGIDARKRVLSVQVPQLLILEPDLKPIHSPRERQEQPREELKRVHCIRAELSAVDAQVDFSRLVATEVAAARHAAVVREGAHFTLLTKTILCAGGGEAERELVFLLEQRLSRDELQRSTPRTLTVRVVLYAASPPASVGIAPPLVLGIGSRSPSPASAPSSSSASQSRLGSCGQGPSSAASPFSVLRIELRKKAVALSSSARSATSCPQRPAARARYGFRPGG